MNLPQAQHKDIFRLYDKLTAQIVIDKDDLVYVKQLEFDDLVDLIKERVQKSPERLREPEMKAYPDFCFKYGDKRHSISTHEDFFNVSVSIQDDFMRYDI